MKVREYFYDPNDIANITQEQIDNYNVGADNFYEIKKDGMFHIGDWIDTRQGREALPTIYCAHCGGNTFHVGIQEYYVGIKCTFCGWELCIYSG